MISKNMVVCFSGEQQTHCPEKIRFDRPYLAKACSKLVKHDIYQE